MQEQSTVDRAWRAKISRRTIALGGNAAVKENEITIGTVAELWRYPVKSLAGESVTKTTIGWHGLTADRRYAFIKAGNQTGFPWLTIRDCPALVRYQGLLGSTESTGAGEVSVKTPDGRLLRAGDSGLLSEIEEVAARSLHLLQHNGGLFDTSDIGLITDKTLKGLAEVTGEALDVRRFRPNIFIKSSEDREFPEDEWVGGLMVFGERGDSARVRITRVNTRCSIPAIDPCSGEKNARIQQVIIAHRKNIAGVYGAAQLCGTVEVGDAVRFWID
jgi:uncharacterized protein